MEMQDPTDLSLWIPALPPSENRVRVHRRQGGQVYSKEARDYQTVFAEIIRTNYLIDVARFVAGHTDTSVYSVSMIFHFETLVNAGWESKKAKTRYKKMDVGNRRKLIEDCLSSALGVIDDSLFFDLHLRKCVSNRTGVRILVERQNPADYGVPDVRRGS
jgi:Holliday junction resolvase RusA-like endonuclease